jgi:hypothetical protein
MNAGSGFDLDPPCHVWSGRQMELVLEIRAGRGGTLFRCVCKLGLEVILVKVAGYCAA